MFELGALLAQCSSAAVVTQSTILFSSCVHVHSGLRDSGTYIYILSLKASPPRDGLSSGTESNLPVIYPTPGIQIVEYASMIVRQDHLCLRTKSSLRSSGRA